MSDSTPDGQNDARVTTVTAEVKSMMVGSRQVTLSVYGQLDFIGASVITPMGRVKPKDAEWGYVYIVGKHSATGQLARARTPLADVVIEKHVQARSGVRTLKSDLREAEKEAGDSQGRAEKAEKTADEALHGTTYQSDYSADGYDRKMSAAEALAGDAATELERLKALTEVAEARYRAADFRAKAQALLDEATAERENAEDALTAADRLREGLREAVDADSRETRRLTTLAVEWAQLPLIVLAGLR
jgi:hypothetical protein